MSILCLFCLYNIYDHEFSRYSNNTETSNRKNNLEILSHHYIIDNVISEENKTHQKYEN